MTEKSNYELTSEKNVNLFGIKLYRLRCKKTFTHKLIGEIKEGTLGGWIQSLDNISVINEVYFK